MHTVLTSLNAKYIHTNLAIRYLKAYASEEFNVSITEYTIKDPIMNIVTDLYKRQPEVIGFSCYIWNIKESIEVIKMLKKIDPQLVIIVGGPEVTYDTKHWMETVPEIDFISIGEGEATFKQFLQAINDKSSIEEVSGLAYRDDGKIIMNPQRNKIDLKTLPSPFNFKEDLPHLSKRVTYIETSRGCPFSCQFCLSSIEVGVRYFDREKIKEDIRHLMRNGAKTIKFVDRTFNISRSYALEMFQFLIDEHIPGTVFQFEITADIMRPEVIQFLNENAPEGLFRFEIGVQSTNDETNELVKRKQNFNKLTRTVSMVKEGGKIDQHLDLIAGLPEEDYHSFRQTFNDVFALRPEELQLGFLKMLRGTGLRLSADKHQYIFMDTPPYEILGNNVLSFDDIIKIKQVEDVLEKYWNDHRMDETIEFIVCELFDTPFDFFQQFGSYWEVHDWSRIGHQLEDLFYRLYEFIKASSSKQSAQLTKDLLTYDYLRLQKHRPRKSWWKGNTLTKEEQKQIYKVILQTPETIGGNFSKQPLLEKDLFKHTRIETFTFDLEHYLKKKEIKLQETLVLFYYKNENVQLYSSPLDEIQKKTRS
ncbi:B12-binding domain-containing radical SAM protein [Bacillus carboniphilus]|uniref:B12-binding domain-containing radical SAM protein n=1 Tax=Bacillus carboniphilus TaxID=86663 RepID=A0ABY9JWG6_9BACI|nr:B12-binding domain-containing radical SAM protein [Bacillus carboniphilus]WLR43118.1 B12-binding domain-containing radical SAM protein [Bacillus carboniphilus]